MRIALVHDWLTGMRGGERCLEAFVRLYPQADIYTLLHVPGTTSAEIDRRVRGTSILQQLPGARRYYRVLLPFYPAAVAGIRLREYDLVISLSHAAAKNVEVPPGIPHVCYCFTPMRYIWDQAHEYFGHKTSVLWPIIKSLRNWDVRRSESVTYFVAISRFVAARIRRFYGRNAVVIHPPVDTSWISSCREGTPGEAFLCAGALVPYKRVDRAIESCRALRLPLWVVGEGPERVRLEQSAGAEVEFLGHLSGPDFAERLRRCRALIFPGIEDFGMVPVECQASGRPVVGLGRGGLVETVRGLRPWAGATVADEASTGVFSGRGSSDLECLEAALDVFLKNESRFRAASCRRQARLFSPEVFRASWRAFAVSRGLPPGEPETCPSGLVSEDLGAEAEKTAV